MQITPTVKQLLIINILVYLGSQFVPESYNYLSLFYFQSSNFQLWQPLTHMFMHAPAPNFMHILFNMFALYSFGSALEQFWGGKKFLFFYISCGLGSALLHSGVNYLEVQHGVNLLLNSGVKQSDINIFLETGSVNEKIMTVDRSVLQSVFNSYHGTAVGASGAIYGLLVAFAFMFPNAQLGLMFIPIPIKAKYFVSGLLVIDLVMGIRGTSIFGAGSGIAHFAHIGGALVGFLMMWYWKKNQFHGNRWN